MYLRSIGFGLMNQWDASSGTGRWCSLSRLKIRFSIRCRAMNGGRPATYSLQSVRPVDTMGLLAKIFGGVPRDEMRGIHLDMGRPFWEVSGKTDFPTLLMALLELLPGECVLYFEGG